MGIPASVGSYTAKDVTDQVVRWRREPWAEVFAGHEPLMNQLGEHVDAEGGIKRDFVHARAAGDPVELFLLAMAWGYGPVGYGPRRTAAILSEPESTANLTAIVEASRTGGAEGGWKALFRTNPVNRFKMSFGTKLLYFAGFATDEGPRPLILDEFVRKAFQREVDTAMPLRPRRVTLDDYLNYCQIGEDWSEELGRPDVLEYALFDLEKRR